jgi:hypothetical protein
MQRSLCRDHYAEITETFESLRKRSSRAKPVEGGRTEGSLTWEDDKLCKLAARVVLRTVSCKELLSNWIDNDLSSPYLIPYPATQPYESVDSAGKITIFRVG